MHGNTEMAEEDSSPDEGIKLFSFGPTAGERSGLNGVDDRIGNGDTRHTKGEQKC